MKNLLLGLLFVSTAFCSEQQSVRIVDYEPSHKDAAMEIFFQDPELLFGGSQLVTMGIWTMEQFNSENRKVMETILADPLRIKRIAIDSGKIAGFINFCKTKEHSLESLKRQAAFSLTPEQEAQFVVMNPYLKKTDAECEIFAKIETVAVSRDFRRRGHARTLIKNSIDYIKQNWPMIHRVELDVNAVNENAKKLYESEGFKQSVIQPQRLVMMQAVQYEKAL